MKINYVIASWNGPRVYKISKSGFSKYEKVLKTHIKQISNLEHNLTKITLMKPGSPHINSYYDIDYSDNIQVISCPNKYQSYGQWLTAIEMFVDEYDYFILMEDDYIPNIDNFDSKLIQIYEEGTYLCSKVSDFKCLSIRGIVEPVAHCAISNGIISSKTIKDLIKQNNFRSCFDRIIADNQKATGKNWNKNAQVVFSRYLSDNNILLKDYLNHYGADFHYNDEIIDHSINNKEKIITPIQNTPDWYPQMKARV